MIEKRPSGDDDKRRNKKIGECAGHVHVALHSYADMHGLKPIDRMQALLAVLQNLASLMRDSNDATT
jgi:hypothetical protein